MQQGLGELNLLLEQAERGIVKRSHKASSMEAELTTLRCQVLTLRYQLDAVEAAGLVDASQSEQVHSLWFNANVGTFNFNRESSCMFVHV